MGMNLTLTGRLGKDPETRTSQKGSPFTKLAVAHGERSRDGQETTTWFDVLAFGQQGNFASQFLHKGDYVQIIGPMKVESYQGKDGQTRFSISVTANTLEKMPTGGGRGNGGNGGGYQNCGGNYQRQQAPQQQMMPPQDYVGAQGPTGPNGEQLSDQVPF